jgi:site-specific recombinase XerD
LRRKNVSPNTVKNYLHGLKHFVLWLDIPLETVTHRKVNAYIDDLMGQRLKPKTINCYLNSVCQFYRYLSDEDRQPREETEHHEAAAGTSQASER